jgi:UDP-N-acetylglucosamine 4,6-dehydratase
VVPLFAKLIAKGQRRLPITDPRMTRFWITLEQGVDFVTSTLARMAGGEIFVPKIPSMNMVDLAMAMAPDAEPRIIGIRPGEKLHEVMITEDDARNTVEFPDRYAILPTHASWGRRGGIDKGGTPVVEGFRYASNTNPEWLDATGLRELLDLMGN